MKRDRPERAWNRKRSTVDLRSRGSSGQCFDVASRTTDLDKQAYALLCGCAVRELGITRGRFRGANKPREVINVGEAVRSRRVIRLRNRVANLGHLIRLKPVRDAHLVEVCVGGER